MMIVYSKMLVSYFTKCWFHATATCIGTDGTPDEYTAIAQFYEAKSEFSKAGGFYRKSNEFAKALRLFLQVRPPKQPHCLAEICQCVLELDWSRLSTISTAA